MKDERIIKLAKVLEEINYSEEAQKERNETFREARGKLIQLYHEMLDIELSLIDYDELFKVELMYNAIDSINDLQKEIEVTLDILES